MIGKTVSADGGSTAVGGDNLGTIINVGPGAIVNLNNSVATERGLGTCLGTVISVIAQQRLSDYGHAYQHDVTNEVLEKLNFNYITISDHLVQIYRKYYFLLDRAYKGVEQSNNDARVLVRLRAGSIYSSELTKACTEAEIPSNKRVEHSRNNSHALIDAVKQQLVQDVMNSQAATVDIAWIDLAVSLLVADAVAECAVLEKAPNVATA